MKKILFGITSLSFGGAERVLADLVNRLSNEFDITIFTLYGRGELEKQINKNVKIVNWNKKSYKELSKLEKMLISLKLLLLKKNIYNKYFSDNYDVEIAFLEGPTTRLFSVKNNKTKKVAWIHNDITKVFGNGIKANIKKRYDENVYNKYQKLIFVSKDNLQKFKQMYTKTNKDNLEVIYNYIDKEKVIEQAEEKAHLINNEQTSIVSVARLVEQKAIDRLMKVHKKLIDNGYKNKVYVIGDGPQKEKLKYLQQKLKIEETFILLGKKENPYPYIKNADIFCLLSYYEGYGMVIEEAKILNKFIVITDTAAREAIQNYEYSKVVLNTEEAIYEALKKVLSGKEYLNSNIKKIDYDNNEIIKKIVKLIKE